MFTMIVDGPFLCLSKPSIGLDTTEQLPVKHFSPLIFFDLSEMMKPSNKFVNEINKLVNKIKFTTTVSEVIKCLTEIQVLRLNQH